MSVTVGEILVAARAGLACLTCETVGYLVLGAADRVCPASPASFDANDIELDDRGTVTVPGVRPAAQDQCELQLRSVLRDLLGRAQSGSAALDRVGRSSERGPDRLIGEIEAALIPVNRAAARRALARLHRDVTRARVSGELARAAAKEALASLPDVVPPAQDVAPSPVVELPPVEPRATEAPAPEQWAASAPTSSWASSYQPEATPFLGAWPVAQLPEHDTDHAPPVAPEEAVALPPADRSDVAETTQVLFATAVEVTQPIQLVEPDGDASAVSVDCEPTDDESLLDEVDWVVDADDASSESVPSAGPEREWDCIARIMGPVWTPIVEADVALVHVAAQEDQPESIDVESEDSWIVSFFAGDEQSPKPEAVAAAENDAFEPEWADATRAEAEPTEIELAETEPAPAESAGAALVEAEPEEAPVSPAEPGLFAPVASQPAILEPARHAGWCGWILTPGVPGDPRVAEMSELLLDGASIASFPAPTESELFAASANEESFSVESPPPAEAESTRDDHASAFCADIDVMYEEDEPAAESVLEVVTADVAPVPDAVDDDLPSVVQNALLEWVVRDEALYEDILGVQDDVDDVAPARDDIGEFVEVQNDIGEIDWIRAEENLSETPCEVPVAKYDPRESYAPQAMLERWVPQPELDADAIDAGWEIDSESSLPPVAVSARSEAFPVESPTPPPYRPRQSDVSELLAGFAVAETRSLRELSRDLKRIAGVAVTPAPSAASPLAARGGGVETSPSCTSRTWPSSRDS